MNSICKLGKGVIFQLKLHNISPLLIFQQSRTAALYGPVSLGVDKYNQAREQFVNRMSQMIDSFRSKMVDFTKEGSNNMVFTEDLKSMVHISEKSDVELVEKMMKKFNAQNKEMRFGSYIFGPVVMRMYYFLDLPDEAYKAFKDPQLSGFFDQLMSYHALMDLLYKHEKYTEILDVFDYVKSKQPQMLKFPRHILVLAMGALYKQNSEESLKRAIQIWTEMRDVGHLPMRRSVTFLAALALNQGSPHIALEVLSSVRNQNYYSVRNMKIYALSELNRPEDAFPIIRSVLEFDGPKENSTEFLQECLERLEASVERSNNSDAKREFTQLLKALTDRNAIDKKRTIDDLLSVEVVVSQPLVRSQMSNQQQRLEESFSNRGSNFERRQFNKPNFVQRGGLADRY